MLLFPRSSDCEAVDGGVSIQMLNAGVVRKRGAKLWERSARRRNNGHDVVGSPLKRNNKVCQGEDGQIVPVISDK